MLIGLLAVGEFGDRLVMSPEVTEELIARQPLEAQAVIRILMARIDALEARLASVTKTPQNSSLPPSTQHPHAKPSCRTPARRPRRRGIAAGSRAMSGTSER